MTLVMFSKMTSMNLQRLQKMKSSLFLHTPRKCISLLLQILVCIDLSWITKAVVGDYKLL